MAGSRDGALRAAAKRIGLSETEYRSNVAAGLEHCGKCRRWHPVAAFAIDRSRSDGRSPMCRSCRSTRSAPGPTKIERAKMALASLAWCRHCLAWLPADGVDRGSCRVGINAADRARYAANPGPLRRRAIARRRRIDPIPDEGIEVLAETWGGVCAYCTSPATTYDHVVPVSKGGVTRKTNIVPACVSCNSSKRDHDPAPWIVRGFSVHPLPWSLWWELVAEEQEELLA